MKLRIVSDMHISFYRNSLTPLINHNPDTFFVPKRVDDDEHNQILVIAGDMCEVREIESSWVYDQIFAGLSSRFRYVLYVMGNHDHYHGIIDETYEKWENALRKYPNFIVLENETFDIDGIRFAGCTLWTDFDRGTKLDSPYTINDFRGLIRKNTGGRGWEQFLPHSSSPPEPKEPIQLPGLFTPQAAYSKHRSSVGFLASALEAKHSAGKKTVVITHHAPHMLSVDDKYKEPPYNHYNHNFVSDLSTFMLGYHPDMWIHGHVHDAFDYNVFNDCGHCNLATRVVCNPFAYPHEHGENGFEDYKIIEV